MPNVFANFITVSGRICLSKCPHFVSKESHRIFHFQRYFASGNSLPILTLYTKEECSLCDNVVEILQPFMHRVKFEKVDITEDENKQWYRKYRYDIPVFHLNGQFLMKHQVNENLLTEKLLEIEKTNKMNASKT